MDINKRYPLIEYTCAMLRYSYIDCCQVASYDAKMLRFSITIFKKSINVLD